MDLKVIFEAGWPAERQAPAEKYPVSGTLCFRFPFALVNALPERKSNP